MDSRRGTHQCFQPTVCTQLCPTLCVTWSRSLSHQLIMWNQWAVPFVSILTECGSLSPCEERKTQHREWTCSHLFEGRDFLPISPSGHTRYCSQIKAHFSALLTEHLKLANYDSFVWTNLGLHYEFAQVCRTEPALLIHSHSHCLGANFASGGYYFYNCARAENLGRFS